MAFLMDLANTFGKMETFLMETIKVGLEMDLEY